MNLRKQWWLAGIGIVALVVAGGCGPKGPKLYPVKGKLTKGGQPLKNVGIDLLPDGHNAQTASANVDENGAFELRSGTDGRPGAQPGKYKVVLRQLPSQEDSAKSYSNPANRPAGGVPGVPTPTFPEEFLQVGTTKKTVDIEAKENLIDIDVGG